MALLGSAEAELEAYRGVKNVFDKKSIRPIRRMHRQFNYRVLRRVAVAVRCSTLCLYFQFIA